MKPQTWQERVDDEFRTWNKGERQRMKDFFAPELQRAREEAVEEAIWEVEAIERIERNFTHTVGSHSDDRGGESDYPCECLKESKQGALGVISALKVRLTALKNLKGKEQ